MRRGVFGFRPTCLPVLSWLGLLALSMDGCNAVLGIEQPGPMTGGDDTSVDASRGPDGAHGNDATAEKEASASDVSVHSASDSALGEVGTEDISVSTGAGGADLVGDGGDSSTVADDAESDGSTESGASSSGGSDTTTGQGGSAGAGGAGAGAGGRTGRGGNSGTGGRDGGASGGASGGAGGSAADGGAGAGGAPVTCDASQKDCGGTCVDIASNANHCGECNHACGPRAGCSVGECQPFRLTATDMDTSGLAVATSGVYFTTPIEVLKCPLEGCTLSPTQLYGAGTSLGLIAAWSDYVAFSGVNSSTSRTALFACPQTGCTATPPSIAAGSAVDTVASPRSYADGFVYAVSTYGVPVGFNVKLRACVGYTSTGGCVTNTTTIGFEAPLALDATNFYAMSVPKDGGAKTVQSCPIETSCDAPLDLFTYATPIALAVSSSTLLVAYAQVGPSTSYRILPCSKTGTECLSYATFPSPLVSTSTAIVNLTANDEWMVWSTAADIFACPVDGCPGGGKRIAASQPNPTDLTLFSGFVYWRNQGTGTANIMRVALPLPPPR